MKNITLGQYFPGNSPVHRLDPRTKILLMIAYIVVIFLVNALILYVLPFAFVLFAIVLSHVPVSYVTRSLKPLRFLLVFMFIINLFFTPGETALLSFWRVNITSEALLQALFISIRLILLVGGTSLMTLTTSPIALTDGLEKLLKPLSRLRFPSHELAMMMTIALRFIPTLMEEAVKIQKAQMARGADFESGNVINRAKSMIPILVPLFISAFRRADELAMAMESRCYHGGEGRTRMRELRFGPCDAVAASIVLLVAAAIIALQYLMQNGWAAS
ncbi:MAG: energy-coupling factor transporter transmembrane protein EcfT [Clostridiales bacterium]|jgi:energy-coupling factor transport system permease protein|nr:energy-coupling factor transporter transmembrane protein EcfT [Clostridiales bacterium]